MENILHESHTDLQERDYTKDTIARIAEINLSVDKEAVPDGFDVDDEGVWLIQERKEGAPTKEWISSPLWVTAHTRDHRNENHGRVLEFQDIDNHKHRWTMPMDLLASEGSKIIGALLNMGLIISPKKYGKERLLEYIARSKPLRRARCVSQCGWFNQAFVLPSTVIGYIQSERIVYQNFSCLESKSSASGSLTEWSNQVAGKAIGNSRLILSISAAFGGPLLRLTNHENIGVHYRGNSSLGKSTAEYVANSVWGPLSDIHTFRATANGLEGIASLHNDRLLCLDELGQISPHEAGHVIYMLGNGMGKGRATQQGAAKKQATWRLVFLSTGELGLTQLMLEIGKRVKAGQEVRFIEIPADTGKYGLFENLHEFENGADFATYLKNTCAALHGIASKAFLTKLVEDIEGATATVEAIINGIRQQYLPKDASAQAIRVFNHFALIAAAGELASQFGITGWEVEDAVKGVMKCFQDWIESRGDTGMHEEKEALLQVRTFFELHGESRFTSWDRDANDKNRTSNRVGYRKETEEGTEFYVFPNLFRSEICKGLDHRLVEQVCIKHKYLSPSPDGAPTRAERLPGAVKTKRCYRFKSEILSE